MAGAGSPKFTSETAPRTGGKPGRKTRARAMREAAEELSRAGGVTTEDGVKLQSPLAILEFFANDKNTAKQLRISAASSAAKYRHRALAPEPPPPPATPTTAQVLVYIPGNNRDAPATPAPHIADEPMQK